MPQLQLTSRRGCRQAGHPVAHGWRQRCLCQRVGALRRPSGGRRCCCGQPWWSARLVLPGWVGYQAQKRFCTGRSNGRAWAVAAAAVAPVAGGWQRLPSIVHSPLHLLATLLIATRAGAAASGPITGGQTLLLPPQAGRRSADWCQRTWRAEEMAIDERGPRKPLHGAQAFHLGPRSVPRLPRRRAIDTRAVQLRCLTLPRQPERTPEQALGAPRCLLCTATHDPLSSSQGRQRAGGGASRPQGGGSGASAAGRGPSSC